MPNLNNEKCPVCGCTQTKKGKLLGVATLHSLDSRVGVGGSELIFTFCAECGEVMGTRVAEPKKIK